MPHLTLSGLKVAYHEVGDGDEVVIFAHCSCGSHKAWRFMVDALPPGFRALLIDFIGYGESDPWPEDRPYDPYFDVQALLKLLATLDGPVHLIGHSYGGAMALEATLRQGIKVRSLTLIEPVAFYLLRGTRFELEYQKVERSVSPMVAAANKGRMKVASQRFMGYWLGHLRWLFASRKIKANAHSTIAKVAMECDALLARDITPADMAAILCPVRLILGDKTRSSVVATIQLLHESLPGSEVKVIPGAGHMSPFSHPQQLQQLLNQWLELRASEKLAQIAGSESASLNSGQRDKKRA